MSTPYIVVIPPGTADWRDPWAHPEYFNGIARKRILAYLLDLLIVGALTVLVWFVGGLLTVLTFGLLLPAKVLALAVLPLAYHILTLSGPRSATLGMRAMGIRLVSIDPEAAAWGGRPTLFQAIIQVISFYGSLALTGSVILVEALFNPRRRMLHDWLAGTVAINDLSPSHDVG